ncbi:MAG: ATP-binding protein [Candidatus Hydrogenedentes bacterium]|nr:ATP-binding protein [Candidatus Hydrogenedentota bacterium]
MTPVDIRMEVRSEPRLLQSIRSLVRCYVSDRGFSRDKTDEVVLAVDEACTNAIRHAYQGDKDKALHLHIHTNSSWMEFQLIDEGKTAPADRVQPKSAEVIDAEAMTPGGLGMALIYQVFDEVAFSPGSPAGNIITMRLRLPTPTEETT